MLSLDSLRAYGADVDSGLARCMNDEGFYLSLVAMTPADEGFGKLKEALDAGDLGVAFEAAHKLKGAMTNLALTPISEPVVEITELLRSRTEMDYSPLMDRILSARDELTRLCG